jgi:predicted 2-oxoglutarate/Fe(II)-dependent dioxygenase YbiX
MPGQEFFRKLGLYVQPDFLDAATCARIRDEMRRVAADKEMIAVRGEDGQLEEVLDESGRRVWGDRITGPTEVRITAELEALKPSLASCFKVPLDTGTGPNFLRYDVGGLYVPHRDVTPHSPIQIRDRKVSIVIFLNGSKTSSADDDAYGGGDLVFYGLLDGPEWEGCGFPTKSSPGLLLAYPSHVMHEVKPVTSGQRFTIVAWFKS